MIEKNIIRLNSKKLAISSLFLAMSIIINYFRITVPVGGAPVLRIAFGGPFLKYIAILFGPLYGGIAGGLSDIINFLLKPENGFMWPLTVVAILKGTAIGYLWKHIDNMNFKIYNRTYISTFSILIVVGLINLVMVNNFPNNMYSQVIISVGKKADYISIGLIIAGVVGLIINFGAYFYSRLIDDRLFFSNYLKLVIAIAIPSLIGTTINTFILKAYLFLPETAFILILIPRFIEEFIMVLFNTFILLILLKLPANITNTSKNTISKNNI